MGGELDGQQQKANWEYNIKDNTVTFNKNMKVRRQDFGITYDYNLNNIYVLGGLQESNCDAVFRGNYSESCQLN